MRRAARATADEARTLESILGVVLGGMFVVFVLVGCLLMSERVRYKRVWVEPSSSSGSSVRASVSVRRNVQGPGRREEKGEQRSLPSFCSSLEPLYTPSDHHPPPVTRHPSPTTHASRGSQAQPKDPSLILSCTPDPYTKMLGKLVHLTADALIISALLAGIKRSTGLTSVARLVTAMTLALTLSISSPVLDRVPSKDFRCTFFRLLFWSYSHLFSCATTDWFATYLETGRPLLYILSPVAHLVQANTSSTSPSSSLAGRPTLNDVASSLKRHVLDDRHLLYS